MHILLVGDDRRLAAVVRGRLIEARHTVDLAYDGAAGHTLGIGGGHDVIVLKRTMPDRDGPEMCRQVRAAGITAPILMCSALGGVDDCVAAFDAGADDYLLMPFALEEFLARVHALGRRSPSPMAANPAAAAAVSDVPATPQQRPHRAGGWARYRLSGYLHQAWTASMHRLSPGR